MTPPGTTVPRHGTVGTTRPRCSLPPGTPAGPQARDGAPPHPRAKAHSLDRGAEPVALARPGPRVAARAANVAERAQPMGLGSVLHRRQSQPQAPDRRPTTASGSRLNPIATRREARSFRRRGRPTATAALDAPSAAKRRGSTIGNRAAQVWFGPRARGPRRRRVRARWWKPSVQSCGTRMTHQEHDAMPRHPAHLS
jgi:hypothetical protein